MGVLATRSSPERNNCNVNLTAAKSLAQGGAKIPIPSGSRFIHSFLSTLCGEVRRMPLPDMAAIGAGETRDRSINILIQHALFLKFPMF